MTIPVVSKSDEGFYKYTSNEGESPESWVTVRGVGVPLIINKRVGDSVELQAVLETGHFKSLEWKYMGKDIAEFNSDVVYSPGSQFEGRLKMNTKNLSLTVRELTLQDSWDFLLTVEGDKGQIGSKTITLKVHEPISKVAIQTDIKLLANHSCTVRLVCNVSCYPNLTYTWERDNEIYGDAQQIYFSLSLTPAKRNINVKCNASNLVSWKTASATVKCRNDTNHPRTGVVNHLHRNISRRRCGADPHFSCGSVLLQGPK
ncbi:LOW QUALITY PROTEIN: natural killer cell receptor 2B4-like [Oncorhynchus kisutch]|uniref:LOW QUALITY PROTEIN: natural killer cell receptor 2B4-like n=1 Tax=Oncorhynchus kisutch TaxID=8019 RepID=UPI0012DF740E|nr:LOW QUALITY PROTEIN: natural killer cell receptor 2B4-like [Oncorhynchus kisutch]